MNAKTKEAALILSQIMKALIDATTTGTNQVLHYGDAVITIELKSRKGRKQ